MSESFQFVDFYWRINGSDPASDRYLVGVAAYHKDKGWRFFPRISGKLPSRVYHPTWEKCVPRWVGYPDRCETETRDSVYL